VGNHLVRTDEHCFAAGYFAKIPAKKALKDFGLTEMTGAEQFWYVVECIGFGAGYFAEIPTAKALSELPQFSTERQGALGTLGGPAPYAEPSPSSGDPS
jgi:hypothetical protein